MTLEEINAQYTNACAKAGDLQYKINMLHKELEQTLERLKELNQDALTLVKEEAVPAEEKA